MQEYLLKFAAKQLHVDGKPYKNKMLIGARKKHVALDFCRRVAHTYRITIWNSKSSFTVECEFLMGLDG
jgi:hypothetical protein